MLTFDTNDLTLLPFNGWSHLQNHLNYLYRVDSRQKWTNSRTKKKFGNRWKDSSCHRQNLRGKKGYG